VRALLQAARPWLAVVAALLMLAVLVPPLGSLAGRYAYAQALQFAVFAVAVPALLVLAAPWRLQRARAGQDRPGGTGLADRLARARSRHPGTPRAGGYLVAFVALVIVWRLPVTVNFMAGHQVLIAAEVVTLVPAGCGLWLELVESPPLLPRISRPLRAAFAAVAMWTIWVLAYIMGFSRAGWFTAYAHASGLGTAADQQIATGILWAVPALAFPAVVYFSLITWLRDSADPDEELRAVTEQWPSEGQPRFPRPPRGWQAPPT
jgi:hypothetical protein